ncbi:MAG TPA: replicative DNA helicase [Tissierellia bacterium]|nr:replicative DNA helicase [Tissierellia bacterium]
MAVAPKLPPSNLEAEQHLLGSMILNSSALAEGLYLVREEDFFKEAHQIIYRALVELNDRDHFDALVVVDLLRDKGKLKAVGGAEYISELVQTASRTYNVGEYAAIVHEKSIRRKLIEASSAIINECFQLESGRDPLAFAEDMIYSVGEKRNRSGLESIGVIFEDYEDDLKKFREDPSALRGLKTGFIDLDTKTNGLQKGDLILVAGRPSMGKSALAVNIAQKAAIEQDKNVCIFSLEMNKKAVLTRMIATDSGVSLAHLLSLDIPVEQMRRIYTTKRNFDEAKLYIDETSGLTIGELRNKLRQFRHEIGQPIDLVVVDYLQLMEGAGENRQVEISGISRGLKAIAREFNCPLIAVSQLSRGPESRTDKRPMLSDLRESGAIEQDADLVLLLYRDEYYHPDTEEPGVAEVLIAKQRQGETGVVKMAWIGHLTSFENIARNIPQYD